MKLPVGLMPCLSSRGVSALKAMVRESNARVPVGVPLDRHDLLQSSVAASPKGSAVCTAGGGVAGVWAAAGGADGAGKGLADEVGLAEGAGTGLASAAGEAAGAGTGEADGAGRLTAWRSERPRGPGTAPAPRRSAGPRRSGRPRPGEGCAKGSFRGSPKVARVGSRRHIHARGSHRIPNMQDVGRPMTDAS